MDPTDIPSVETDSTRQFLENIQQARTMGLVEGIREATTEHHVDAEGQPLTVDLLRELEYTVRSRGGVQREDVLYFLHPAQMGELRSTEEMLAAGVDPMDLTDEGVQSFQGIPMLVDAHLPPAVVYLVDPQAITLGGQVLYPNRTGRLTGLRHPSADSE